MTAERCSHLPSGSRWLRLRFCVGNGVSTTVAIRCLHYYYNIVVMYTSYCHHSIYLFGYNVLHNILRKHCNQKDIKVMLKGTDNILWSVEFATYYTFWVNYLKYEPYNHWPSYNVIWMYTECSYAQAYSASNLAHSASNLAHSASNLLCYTQMLMFHDKFSQCSHLRSGSRWRQRGVAICDQAQGDGREV